MDPCFIVPLHASSSNSWVLGVSPIKSATLRIPSTRKACTARIMMTTSKSPQPQDEINEKSTKEVRMTKSEPDVLAEEKAKESTANTPRPKSSKKKDNNEAIEKFFDYLSSANTAESALFTNVTGSEASYKFVKFDSDGFASRERFVYVEEVDCIGCTHCSTTARNTFFMEESHGRARVFRQDGDSEGLVQEAIDTCPVNCIYYVSFDDLVTLENERRYQKINNYSRLVGSDFGTSRNTSKAKAFSNGKMRCESCPSRGCKECPLYGVGNNPEYQRRITLREQKRQERRRRGTSGSGNPIGGSGPAGPSSPTGPKRTIL